MKGSMSVLTKEQANALIASNIEQINELFEQSEALAREHGLTFHFNRGYAMEGYYEGAVDPEVLNDEDDYYDDDLKQPGWRNSSSYC